MKDVLGEQAVQRARAAMGITDFLIEGPAAYCRPAGPSSACDDSLTVYQAVIIQPGGVGGVLWNAAE